MTLTSTVHRLIPFAIITLLSLTAQAERADREKPIQIQAQKITIDDAKKIQILEGDVLLTKGTLVIQAVRVIITEDQYGFQKGTAFGGAGKPARFRQKREGSDQYISGEAGRIEYNTSNEVAELFHHARVQSGEDVVRGDYIWYDAVSEKFLVSAGDSTLRQDGPRRVHAVIQPKNRPLPATDNGAPAKGEKLRLQGAQTLGTLPTAEPVPDATKEKRD